ncbi:MAG: riboflavin synthase [Pseudomonadota bacterium]
MFTGLITDVGTIVQADRSERGGAFEIACGYAPETIATGASIACDGCCLTATRIVAHGQGAKFHVDVTPESLDRATFRNWAAGRRINLERSLTAGDELGGHLVTGHVDGVGVITARTPAGNGVRFEIDVPEGLAKYIAEKGSIALDGTSLTVNSVDGSRLSVMLIPHSMAVTTWGERAVGDEINVEVDLLARYVARLAEAAVDPRLRAAEPT